MRVVPTPTFPEVVNEVPVAAPIAGVTRVGEFPKLVKEEPVTPEAKVVPVIPLAGTAVAVVAVTAFPFHVPVVLIPSVPVEVMVPPVKGDVVATLVTAVVK